MDNLLTVQQKKQFAEEMVFKLEPIRTPAEFGPIEFPNVCPERDLRLYLSSKQLTGSRCTAPNPDLVPGPRIELRSRNRMLDQADERLNNIRKLTKTRKVKLNKEWTIVQRLQEALRESSFVFENFIKENMEKRERAEKKIHEELHTQEIREGNINSLVYEMRRLYEVKKIFEHNIRAFKMYENYLQRVVTISEYKDVSQVMIRFGALQEAKRTAFERSQRIMKKIEENLLVLKHKAEENGFIIIGKKNKLCELNQRFGEAQKNSLAWETTVTAVRDNCLKSHQDQNRVRQVCQSLFELMCRRKGLPEGTFEKLKSADQEINEYQLFAISETLLQMEKIIRMVKAATISESRLYISAKFKPISSNSDESDNWRTDI